VVSSIDDQREITMSEEKFYWFNRGNWVEWGGPYDTIEEAKIRCGEAYKSINVKATGPVISIMKQVVTGEVEIGYKWKDADEPKQRDEDWGNVGTEAGS
jgi:hypothetical protein